MGNHRKALLERILFIVLPIALLLGLAGFAFTSESKVAVGLVTLGAAVLYAMALWLLSKSRLKAREERKVALAKEQAYRVAMSKKRIHVFEYDIPNRTLYMPEDLAADIGCHTTWENVPDSLLETGMILPDSETTVRTFFASMNALEPEGACTISVKHGSESLLWMHLNYTTVAQADTSARSIIMVEDITKKLEQRLVYEKWRQTIESKAPETFALFEHNLSMDTSDGCDGHLLDASNVDTQGTFTEEIERFASNFVHAEDVAAFLHLMNRERLLAGFMQGNKAEDLEFRYMPGGGREIKWVQLSIQLVEYPASNDIKGFFLYQDIDEKKRKQLALKARSEEDGLTKTINRNAFIERANQVIDREGASAQHAFIIVDIDHFKKVNDTLGHAAGDRTLSEVASSIRFILRHGDLFGRIGGDEFMICLRNIPYEAVIERRARQICTVVKRTVEGTVPISASLGIAVYPRDGKTFEALYQAADTALYHIKSSGKDGFAFCGAGMAPRISADSPAESMQRDNVAVIPAQHKRSILLVDGDDKTRGCNALLLQKEFRIVEASSGSRAMTQLKRFGTGISLVLIDTSLPDMEGTEILSAMGRNKSLNSIPVIMLSDQGGADERLHALESGASDYIVKPCDPEELLLRIQAAIARTENDRLRIQNGYLLLQSEEEERYRNVIRSTGTIVLEYDWVNSVFSYDEMTGQVLYGNYDERTLWRILLRDQVTDAETVRQMQRMAMRVANNTLPGLSQLEVRLRTAKGETHWFRMRVMRMMDDSQITNKLLITLNDVEEEVGNLKRLRNMAEQDALTGLLNRTTFMEQAEELIRSRPAGYYLMNYVDMDHFKLVNDRFGHAKGDMLLRLVANMISEKIGEGELCSRISADVFAALTISKNNSYNSQAITEGYREALKKVGLPFEITLCIGMYVVDDPAVPVDAALDRASLAHQSIKGNYSKRFAYYDESMRRDLLERQYIESQMYDALASGQFEVYLQPLYRLDNGRVTGAEALVRWNHPERGMLSPSKFIPLFEQNGFIRDMDAYVWEQACKLLKRWQQEGRQIIPVSVNISRVDLQDKGLANRLTNLVEKYGLDSDFLRLEITEGAFEDDTESMIYAVKQLKERGFIVEMDDFGSGYSSLNILKDVPVGALKLDLRFLVGEDASGRGGSIVNSVIRMAKWLALPVIAEGVETPAQAAYLKSIGCDIVQGFLYSRPLPIADFEALTGNGEPVEQKISNFTSNITDANAFWNPDSLETLIFNSYVGGAAIIELEAHSGSFEYIRVNEKYLTTIDADADAYRLLCKDPMACMQERDKQVYLATLRQVAETKEEKICITRRIYERNGGQQVIWLRSRIRILASSSVRYLFYVAVDDITAEKNAQERLHTSQETLLAATTHARLYYWIYDMANDTSIQGILTQNNFGMPEYMSNYPQSLIDTGFVHPDFVEAYLELHRKLKAGAPEASLEIMTRWEDGYEWRRIKYTVVYDAQGKRTRAIGTSENLSAYKELEARFMTALGQCGVMSWVYDQIAKEIHLDSTDAAGNKKTDVYKDVPDSILGGKSIHPDDKEAYLGLYQRLHDGEKSASARIRFRKSGDAETNWIWLRITYTATVHGNGNNPTSIWTAMNISEQVYLECRYNEARQEYDQLNRENYIDTGKANITKGTVCSSGKEEQEYGAYLNDYLAGIQDPVQRTKIAEDLSMEHLRASYLNGENNFSFEHRLTMPGGMPRWVRISGRIVAHPGSLELIAFFFIRDIHGEKTQELLFDGLLHTNFDFVVDVDAANGTYQLYTGDLPRQENFPPAQGRYMDVWRQYVDHEVAPADRATCESRLTLDAVMEALETDSRLHVTHRIQDGKNTRYKCMQIFYIDRPSQHICLARTDITSSCVMPPLQ